jgi:hypothetical protein
VYENKVPSALPGTKIFEVENGRIEKTSSSKIYIILLEYSELPYGSQ